MRNAVLNASTVSALLLPALSAGTRPLAAEPTSACTIDTATVSCHWELDEGPSFSGILCDVLPPLGTAEARVRIATSLTGQNYYWGTTTTRRKPTRTPAQSDRARTRTRPRRALPRT
jgi:hypothetical protein